MIHILTLFNKPDLVKEAIASVEAQTRRDLLHVVQEDKDRDWGDNYPPAVFYNEQARLAASGDYICWLSDDDLLKPDYCELLAGYLDAHSEVGCCYSGAIRNLRDAKGKEWEYCRYEAIETWGQTNLPGGHIDGGQMMVRRSILDQIPYPYTPEAIGDCNNLADALLMDRIACICDLVPVPGWVMTIRSTTQSSHMICSAKGGLQSVNWRQRDGRSKC